MEPKYVTCLNCIDGRVQLPIIHWITKNYRVDFVDMITEPGMDGILADENINLDEILLKVDTSRNAHNTNEIFVVGHFDCVANPVDTEIHWEHIQKAVERMKKLRPECTVTGLWVENQHSVELIVKK
jgi:hypothetical protein